MARLVSSYLLINERRTTSPQWEEAAIEIIDFLSGDSESY